jgi:hypothetical protein
MGFSRITVWHISGHARIDGVKLKSDPNGILSVGNHVSKVLALLPEPPLLSLGA